MLNGQTAYLPTDTIYEAGVAFNGPTVLGVTQGPPKFDPGKTITPIEFDGQRALTQALDRITRWRPKISLTLIEFGGATSGNQLGILEPGSSSATHDHGTTTRIQPRLAGALFATNEYITNFRILFERAGGGYAAIYMPIALVTKWDVQGTNEKEGKIAVELEARLSATDAIATPGKCPYSIELRTSLPS